MKKKLFYTALFVLCVLYPIKYLDFDLDLWSRLAVGKIFFATGKILTVDPFAFTQTKALWIDHEWGSSVVFWFFASRFGDAGLLLLKVAVFFLCLLFIHKTIKLYEKHNPYNILYYIFVILGIFNGFASSVRCQIFTFLFFSMWIYVLEKMRVERKNYIWFFPLSMLIWANMHGGFVAGLGLLFLYGIGEFLNKKPYKAYFVALILSILITLINPYGFEYWKYILQATTMQRPHVLEWLSTDLFASWLGWWQFKVMIFISFVGICFPLIKNKFQNIDKTRLLLTAVMLFLAIKHIKHQPFFAIVVGSLFYSDFYSFFDFLKQKTSSNLQNIVAKFETYKESFIYLLIIVLGSAVIRVCPLRLVIPQEKYPVDSVEFIKQSNLKGHLLSTFNWGSYLTYNLYPNCLVSVDGRYEEVYPEDTMALTSNFIYVIDKHWYDIIKKYKIDALLLDKQFESYKIIKTSPMWKKVFEDETSAVFVRKNNPVKAMDHIKINYDLINKNKFKTSKDFLDKIKELQLKKGVL
jgi:hypothetical protein